MSLEDRLSMIEECVLVIPEIPEVKKCIFCKKYGDINGYAGYMTYKFNSLCFTDNLVKQAIHADSGLCFCNHEKYSEDSLHISRFICNAIDDNNCNIDQYDPFEFIPLVSDFEKMDGVLEIFKEKSLRIDETIDQENIETICNSSKQFIRNAGKEWIMSLDPDKYDIGYHYMVEKYGKGFDLPKLYWESKYSEIQKEKLEGLGIISSFN
jgi:hypothetical protein